MFCSHCGTRLPEEAIYCMKCGKPQKKDVQVDASVWWETCEIVHHYVKTAGLFGMHQSKFQAEAIGSKGKYSAGESSVFQHRFGYVGEHDDPRYKQIMSAHNSLIQKLISEGWEPTGSRGKDWWSERFRRRVK